jgi:hypothetical protein
VFELKKKINMKKDHLARLSLKQKVVLETEL